MSELRCVKKSPSVGWIDGIINRGAPQRRSHKHKGKKDRKGRKEELIKCWIVEFIVHRAAPSSVALARPADPSFFFFFFKNHRENTVCQFPWRRTRRFMAALKSILSNDSCSLTFCQIRGLFGRVYLSQQHRPLHGYSQCSGTKGKEGKKKSPVNYVCAISFSECVFVVLCDAWMNSSRPGDFEGTLKKRDANTASTFLRARGRESAHLVYVGKNLQIYTKKLN